jgi:hypothetical protein
LFVKQQFFNLRSFDGQPELLKKEKALIKMLVQKPNLTISCSLSKLLTMCFLFINQQFFLLKGTGRPPEPLRIEKPLTSCRVFQIFHSKTEVMFSGNLNMHHRSRAWRAWSDTPPQTHLFHCDLPSIWLTMLPLHLCLSQTVKSWIGSSLHPQGTSGFL